MSIPGQPPRSSDGPSESPDNPPEGMLMARYDMHIMVSADFLKALEALAHQCGLNRMQFNGMVFAKGVEALTEEISMLHDEEHQEVFENLARLGEKAGREW